MKSSLRIGTLLLGIALALAACAGGGTQTEATVESAATAETDPTAEAAPTGPPTEPSATASPEPATETPAPETPTPTEEVTASVTAADQAVADGTVTIAEAVMADGGWVVIHTAVDGNPGPVIGFAPLEPGANEDVVVDIDVERATGSLIAMLHVDDGTPGEYEFPDADPPLLMDGEMVIQSFAVSGLAAATEEATPADTSDTSDTAEVAIQGFSFNPEELTIPAGTMVLWTNTAGATHTATADDGTFASGALSSGDAYSFTFNTPGVYAYYCELHGGPGGQGMSAVITVTE